MDRLVQFLTIPWLLIGRAATRLYLFKTVVNNPFPRHPPPQKNNNTQLQIAIQTQHPTAAALCVQAGLAMQSEGQWETAKMLYTLMGDQSV